jgi:hypothetical protein
MNSSGHCFSIHSSNEPGHFRVPAQDRSYISTHAGRRRKSPSPDPRTRVANLRSESTSTTRKKGASSRAFHSTVITVAEIPPVTEQNVVDRGRKSKLKIPVAMQSRAPVENTGSSARLEQNSLRNSESSQSRDRYIPSKKGALMFPVSAKDLLEFRIRRSARES